MNNQHPGLQKLTISIVFGLYLLGVLWGLTTNIKRTRALKFQSIDYGMYMQFSAQLADPQLSNRLSANPEGYNIFGLEEIEAKTSLHQAIHFEPVKYLYVPLYRISQGPIGIFFLMSLLYYTPLLYIYLIHPKDSRQDLILIILFSLLFTFTAASINSLGFDARPRILMTPAFLLLMLAVHYRRPLPEQLIGLGSLFTIREEALLLAPILIAYGFLRGESSRKRLTWIISSGVLWLLYAITLFAYYRWTGYQNYDEYSSLDFFANTPWFLYPALALAILYLFYFIYIWLKKKTLFSDWPLALSTFSFGIFFAMARFTQGWLSRQFVAPDKSAADIWLASLRNPDSSLLLISLLALMAMLWQPLKSNRARQTLLLVLFVAALFTLLDGINVLANHVQTWGERIPPAQVVLELREETDPYTTGILTDEETFQVFYDYEKVALYQRLPWSLYGADQPRYYPQNMDQLGSIVKQNIDYIVVNKSNDGDMQDIFSDLQLSYAIQSENDAYIVYRLETPND